MWQAKISAGRPFKEQLSATSKGGPLVGAAASQQCKHVWCGVEQGGDTQGTGSRDGQGYLQAPAGGILTLLSCLPPMPLAASRRLQLAHSLMPKHLPPARRGLQLLEQAARLSRLGRRLLLRCLELLHLLHRRLERGGGLVNQAPRLARLLQQRGRRLLRLPGAVMRERGQQAGGSGTA